jgi:hypothetical protein
MAAQLPHILEAAGASRLQAISAGALVGPAQVAARIIEASLLARYHPLLSTKLACLMHPLGAAIVAITGGAGASVFAIVHGAGNGVITISRSSLPLAIFGPENYAHHRRGGDDAGRCPAGVRISDRGNGKPRAPHLVGVEPCGICRALHVAGEHAAAKLTNRPSPRRFLADKLDMNNQPPEDSLRRILGWAAMPPRSLCDLFGLSGAGVGAVVLRGNTAAEDDRSNWPAVCRRTAEIEFESRRSMPNNAPPIARINPPALATPPSLLADRKGHRKADLRQRWPDRTRRRSQCLPLSPLRLRPLLIEIEAIAAARPNR